MEPSRNILHDFEEMAGHLSNTAILLHEYKKSLVAEGFSATEAFALVRDYQTILFTSGGTK